MATTTTPGTPRWADRRNDRGGRYARHSGASKNVARAMGYGGPRYAQAVAAGDKTGPPQRTLEWLDGMIDGGRTNPWPLIAAQIEHIRARDLATLSDEELGERWVTVCERESMTQGPMDLNQLTLRGRDCPKALDSVVEKAPVQAVSLLELAAIAAERRARSS